MTKASSTTRSATTDAQGPVQLMLDLWPTETTTASSDPADEPAIEQAPAGPTEGTAAKRGPRQPRTKPKADHRPVKRSRKTTQDQRDKVEALQEITDILMAKDAALKARRAKSWSGPLTLEVATENIRRMMNRGEEFIWEAFDAAEMETNDMSRAALAKMGLDMGYSYGRTGTVMARLEDMLAKRR